jgi:hypothetical protein
MRFCDPHARDLAGTSGELTAKAVGSVDLIANAIAIRTSMLNRLTTDIVARLEVDLVLNIGSYTTLWLNGRLTQCQDIFSATVQLRKP